MHAFQECQLQIMWNVSVDFSNVLEDFKKKYGKLVDLKQFVYLGLDSFEKRLIDISNISLLDRSSNKVSDMSMYLHSKCKMIYW